MHLSGVRLEGARPLNMFDLARIIDRVEGCRLRGSAGWKAKNRIISDKLGPLAPLALRNIVMLLRDWLKN